MQLQRRQDRGPLISLVPMIDVMLILLVFFMVTSTYLNLDMIPMVETGDAGAGTADTSTMLVRIGADGQSYLQGRALDLTQLGVEMRARLDDTPLLSVVLLPSSQATTQQLVSVMDALTQAGAHRLRLMRIEPSE